MRAGRWAAAVLVVSGLALSGCGGSTEVATASGEKPAKVEAVTGSKASKVTLTEQAVARLDIRTAPVARGATAGRTTVPYSALLYDTEGVTWVFEEVGPRAYLRQEVGVEVVDGDSVVMTSGPAVGRTIVTVGAAVLYGTELGTGK